MNLDNGVDESLSLRRLRTVRCTLIQATTGSPAISPYDRRERSLILSRLQENLELEGPASRKSETKVKATVDLS
jgi:hypothetical protein